MAGKRVEMHVSTIVAADDMHDDGMLEEMEKQSYKDKNYL